VDQKLFQQAKMSIFSRILHKISIIVFKGLISISWSSYKMTTLRQNEGSLTEQ